MAGTSMSHLTSTATILRHLTSNMTIWHPTWRGQGEMDLFFALPSPCGVGVRVEVNMRNELRVGDLIAGMSAALSGAVQVHSP
jgi:hypothetical protein